MFGITMAESGDELAAGLSHGDAEHLGQSPRCLSELGMSA